MKIVHLCITQYGIFVCTAYFYKDGLYLRRIDNAEIAGLMFLGNITMLARMVQQRCNN